MYTDPYDDISKQTAHTLERMKIYTEMALRLGDAIHMDGASKLVITILKPKVKKEEK